MNLEHSSEISTFSKQPCQQEPEVYTQGGEIEIEWMIIADHGGFLQCNICDDPDNLSEDCFNQHPLMTCVPDLETWPNLRCCFWYSVLVNCANRF